jgi:glycosyltransferase involved in cell wall biosynthesis
MLGTRAFECQAGARYRFEGQLPAIPDRSLPRSIRRLANGWTLIRHMAVLAEYIQTHRFSRVMLATYVEYLAPIWARWLRQLADKGVVFGAIVHDPVRNYIVGPDWWHRRSIASGYSFLREAFVHEDIDLDTAKPMPGLRTTVIPHGPFRYPPPVLPRETIRANLAIPHDAIVLLSFGQIRDVKNLDRVIRAMARFPGVYLIVAGIEALGKNRPADFYRDLALGLGVGNRCRWLVRFIEEAEVGNLFAASDLIVLTYSRQFRSASGVLNTAISYRKPCLASAGQGNLRSAVSRYDLGIWIEPDSDEEVLEGLKRWRIAPPAPLWELYEEENTWRKAADLILFRLREHPVP